jgi:hypothetical protein
MLANADGADGETAEQASSRAAGVDAGAAGALEATLHNTLAEYNAAAKEGVDAFGKTSFRHAPLSDERAPLYAGRIVPVLHYTMGGIRMGADGAVLREDGTVIPGLHAAGEVRLPLSSGAREGEGGGGGVGQRGVGHLKPPAGSVPKFVAENPDSVKVRSKCTEVERVL